MQKSCMPMGYHTRNPVCEWSPKMQAFESQQLPEYLTSIARAVKADNSSLEKKSKVNHLMSGLVSHPRPTLCLYLAPVCWRPFSCFYMYDLSPILAVGRHTLKPCLAFRMVNILDSLLFFARAGPPLTSLVIKPTHHEQWKTCTQLYRGCQRCATAGFPTPDCIIRQLKRWRET